MTRLRAYMTPQHPAAARSAAAGSSARAGGRGGAVCLAWRGGQQDLVDIGLGDAKVIRTDGWTAVDGSTGGEQVGVRR
jgi:hypothetical protein